ncbi:unnamed protein product [Amaranthus hypochondriacus]
MASITETQGKAKIKIYSWWRSSASARVLITLHLKGLEYEYKEINILKGDQFTAEFKKISPRSFVPVLVDGDVVITESTAIIQYLEERYPQPSILPPQGEFQKRALHYQVASMINASMQPFINIQVLKYIEEKVGAEERIPWAHIYFKKGFSALENLLKEHSGKYALGDEVGMADVFLAPEIDGAVKLFNLDMSQFPLLKKLSDETYHKSKPFMDAVIQSQPDA